MWVSPSTPWSDPLNVNTTTGLAFSASINNLTDNQSWGATPGRINVRYPVPTVFTGCDIVTPDTSVPVTGYLKNMRVYGSNVDTMSRLTTDYSGMTLLVDIDGMMVPELPNTAAGVTVYRRFVNTFAYTFLSFELYATHGGALFNGSVGGTTTVGGLVARHRDTDYVISEDANGLPTVSTTTAGVFEVNMNRLMVQQMLTRVLPKVREATVTVGTVGNEVVLGDRGVRLNGSGSVWNTIPPTFVGSDATPGTLATSVIPHAIWGDGKHMFFTFTLPGQFREGTTNNVFVVFHTIARDALGGSIVVELNHSLSTVDGAAVQADGTTRGVYPVTALLAAKDTHRIPISAVGLVVGSQIMGRLVRDQTDPLDTIGADVLLTGVSMVCEVDTMGSMTATAK
jgi:hypothetical protein